MNIYQSFGLREVINGNGKMTILGASAVGEQISEHMKDALGNFVILDELIDYAGTVIAEKTGAEDGCPTCGAASGTAIAAAAVIAGEDLHRIYQLPDSSGMANEIIIQKGHVINFGAKITQMIRIGGGVIKEAGCANKVEAGELESGINENTAALFYVKSHHAVQKGMLSVEAMIAIGKKYRIPVIVDAAAEEDLRKYIALGAELVIYSGGKALSGPTSGFICGKKSYIDACKKQYKGIGRSMKVSKEGMTGLITALNQYGNEKESENTQKQRMQAVSDSLNEVNGLSCRVVQDEAGREIYRCEIKIDASITKITAEELNEKLKQGNPAIYLREYYVKQGLLSIDPRPLLPGQEKIIIEQIKQYIREA